jgi:hypothetical protein
MKIIIVLALLVIALGYSIFAVQEPVALLTDHFLNLVVSHDPEGVANLFCSEGNLIGTVSRIERTGEDIRLYFEYFANLPNIRVMNKKYIVHEIENDVWINNAFVTWMWDGLEKPITARMTFVVKDNCIYELHSSELPKENKKLHKISNNF